MRVRHDYPVVEVRHVVDGDTVDVVVRVEAAFRVAVLVSPRLRLAIVDTPERGDNPGYGLARDALRAWAGRGPLRVASYAEDRGQRWLADLYDPATGETASEHLLREGLAVVWKG